ELTYEDRRRVHNLKYFTWVEQQGKTYDEIQDQWYERDFWTGFQEQIPEIDELIEEFNAKVGLI
ncbi:MAG: pyridoxal-5-phosphate-dependent protein subunit beta, partial [Anaerolineales bacterium]